MKENSIEECVKILERFSNENVIYGSTVGMTLEKYKDLQLSTEHILSDYKRALKENEHKTEKIENQKAALAILNEKQKDFNKLQNTLSSYKGQFRRQEKEIEELKGLIAHKNEYTKKLEEDLFENSNNYVIPIQKVKDKIKEEKLPLTIVGGRKNKKTLEYGIKLGRRQALQELIEEREKK